MTRSAADLEGGDEESARFLQAVDVSIEPARASAGGAPVTLPANAIGWAAFRRDGEVLARDPRFAAWFDPLDVEVATDDWLAGPREPGLIPLHARDGAATVLLMGGPADTRAWPLPAEARAAADGGAFLALAYRPFEDRALADRALASWRLTPLEARITHGLISGGDLIEGARLAGAGYETARKALKLALRKAGATRQTDLVRLAHAAVGGGDLQLSQAPLLQASLGLSERAAGACLLLALGLTRAEAAKTLRISEHAMKDELTALYGRFGLRSATDLSRMTTEAVVLLGLAGNPNVAVAASWGALRPLRFVNRRDQAGRIALSDFGPASGEPTLLFHSATTGSLLDRRLVRALQARGLRPIAVERPGFGLSDPPERDPETTGLNDVLTLLDAYGFKRVRLLSRGGESIALDLGLHHPDRLSRVVLINPFTPYEVDSRWDGFLNGAKRLFVKHPHLIEPLGRFLAQRATPEVYERLTRDALRGSEPDMAVMRDPQAVEDYVESARLAPLQTTWGFVNDQRIYLSWKPPTLPDAVNWTRIVGAHDVLYRHGDADPLWETALPGHRTVRVPDGGRLIHASHPDLVAEEMAR